MIIELWLCPLDTKARKTSWKKYAGDWEWDLSRLYTNTTAFYIKRLAHLQIVISVEGPETNSMDTEGCICGNWLNMYDNNQYIFKSVVITVVGWHNLGATDCVLPLRF